MRCSASPTTSTAAERPADADLAARAVRAILFREVLRPLAGGLGPLGEIALAPLAERLAGIARR
jgi:hypothetical protein